MTLMTVRHGALLVAVALGCAAASLPGQSRTLDDMVREDLDNDHAFPWSAARPLTWNDFQASPPDDGPEGARISYTLYSAWRCRNHEFEFRVIAGMRPRKSWVKSVVLNDIAQRRTILGHEQTHFDLGEVHARRMRRAFEGLDSPCRKRDGGLSALAHQLADEEKAEQRRYDAETNHGVLGPEQADWTRQTRRRLAASR